MAGRSCASSRHDTCASADLLKPRHATRRYAAAIPCVARECGAAAARTHRDRATSPGFAGPGKCTADRRDITRLVIPRGANRLPVLLFGGLLLIYCCGHLAWYSLTALGRQPVLDEREMLELAARIAQGTLPAEAFYRAPLYAALLALPLLAGLEPALLPLLARGVNGALHLLTAWLAADLAGRLWRTPSAPFIAGGLVGLHPLLLHFAGDALDITFAMALMMAGVRTLVIAAGDHRGRMAACAIAATWFAVGTLARPQLLPLLVAPVLLSALAPATVLRRLARGMLVTVPALVVLLSFGAINHALSGDFRVLPWQGAYNLWAANRPGAHGRYFEQSLAIHTRDPAANTARLEAALLYRQRVPDGPHDYRAESAYWRRQTLAAIAADPLRWLRLLTSKGFYLLNNVEQYNNKTFAFHQARAPWLRYNPICWAVVLGLAAAGLSARRRPRALTVVAACATVYAAGVLLFFVSDRFRAPLVPLLAVSAGGVGALLADRDWRALAIGLAFLLASLWPLPPAERTRTFVQDHLAIGRAHSELGEHREAAQAARAALALAPRRPAAQALACVTEFNAVLYDTTASRDALREPDWEHACAAAASYSPAAARLAGYARWLRGDRAGAHRIWRALADEDHEEGPTALAWLALTGGLRAVDRQRIARELSGPGAALLALVVASQPGHEALRAGLGRRYGEAGLAREYASLARLFGDGIERRGLPH